MTRVKQYRTNILFPRPSILSGVGSIFNLPGNYFEFKYFQSGDEADRKAIENDWGVVGNDIRNVTIKLKNRLQYFQD